MAARVLPRSALASAAIDGSSDTRRRRDPSRSWRRRPVVSSLARALAHRDRHEREGDVETVRKFEQQSGESFELRLAKSVEVDARVHRDEPPGGQPVASEEGLHLGRGRGLKAEGIVAAHRPPLRRNAPAGAQIHGVTGLAQREQAGGAKGRSGEALRQSRPERTDLLPREHDGTTTLLERSHERDLAPQLTREDVVQVAAADEMERLVVVTEVTESAEAIPQPNPGRSRSHQEAEEGEVGRGVPQGASARGSMQTPDDPWGPEQGACNRSFHAMDPGRLEDRRDVIRSSEDVGPRCLEPERAVGAPPRRAWRRPRGSIWTSRDPPGRAWLSPS
jgi:hypothetical protein